MTGPLPPSVVLVHGLYHDPQHFNLIARALRAKGFDVAVPELHRGSLEADTEAVQQVVDTMSRLPVVFGHSYGGSVITGLTSVAHLVYVAAFVPAEGESAAGLGGTSPQLASAIVPSESGATHLAPGVAADLFYHDCPAELAKRAVSLLRPQLPGCRRGIPRRHAWRDTPSTYAVCQGDLVLDPALQARMASRCGTVRTWPSGHSPFLSRPDLVVELIDEVSRQAVGPDDKTCGSRVWDSVP
jgi:pimeloyl-ACP methyl ester carboxylesterase